MACLLASRRINYKGVAYLELGYRYVARSTSQQEHEMTITDKLRALQIKANIIADDQVGLMEIEPEVDDGVVILHGEVESEEQKRIAEALAYDIDGVIEVRNELTVVRPTIDEPPLHEGPDAHLGYGPIEGDFSDTAFALSDYWAGPGPGVATTEQFPGQFTDEQIEREVRHRLHNQHEVDASNVGVRSDNQVVTLRGVVRTASDLNILLDVVLNARGVMAVNSQVTIQEGEIGTPTE